MALPAGYVLVEPQKTKLPEGYTLVSQKDTDQGGLPSIAKKAPREEPREAPTYDPLGQVIGDVPAPLDYQVEGQGRMNEPGAFTTIADLAKQFIAPGVKAPFALPQATETAFKGAARQAMEGTPEAIMPSSVFQPGLDTEETLFGPETEQQKARRKLQAQRAVAAMPSIPGAAALNKIGENVQKDILGSLSPEAKKALKESQITGNIFKGEVDFGTNPNAYGYALQAANVFGSMAPVIATAMVTKSPGVGGFVGGTMAADEAATSAAEFINKIPDAELRQKSPFYAELIAGGASPKEARELTIKKAAESGAALQGLVATFGDVLTGKLVTGAFDKTIAKLGTNRAARAAGVGTASGLEEALQETGEGLSSDVALKNVIPSKELGEDSAANFILGALGGAGPGVFKGALSEGEAKAPAREKYVQPEGGLAELMARQKGFLTPEGRPPAPPAAPAAQAPVPPAPPAGPAEAMQAPESESRDTRAMLEELINSVNYPQEKAPEIVAKKPVEAPPVEAPVAIEAPKEEAPEKPESVTLYRGVPKGQEGRETVGGALFMSPDPEVAQQYAGPNGNVTKESRTFDNILNASTWANAKQKLGLPQSATMADLVNAAREAGHDGVTFKTTNGQEYIAINKAPAAEAPKVQPKLSDKFGEDLVGNFKPGDTFKSEGRTWQIEEVKRRNDGSGLRAVTADGGELISQNFRFTEPKPAAEEDVLPDEAFGITGGTAPKPQEFVEAKEAVDQVTKQVTKMRAKPAGSLWSRLTGTLNPEELREIFGNKPNLGQRRLGVVQGEGSGAYIVDMVDDGLLDGFLPPNMRHDSNTFDATTSAQYIKDAIGNRDYLPFDAKAEVEMMFGSVESAERLVKEYLTEEEQNRELQIAADEQREIDQEAEVIEPSDKDRVAPADKREALELTAPTEEELKSKQDEIDRLTKENERLAKEAEAKAKADEAAKDFVLTGSNREADQAAARGQKDIFAEEPTESKSLKAMRGEKFVPDALDKKAIAIYKQIKKNNPDAEVDEEIENPNHLHEVEEQPNSKGIKIGDLVYRKGNPVPEIAITVGEDSVKLIDQKTGTGLFTKIEGVSKEPIPHDYNFNFGYGKIDVDVETFTSPTEWSVDMRGPGASKTGYRSALGVVFKGKRGTPEFDKFVEQVVRNNTKQMAEAAPADNKKEIADLRKEQKTLMLQIIKAGMEETPEQETRMAEISKRIDELEGKPAKPVVKQRSVEEIEEELQDLEDELDNEISKDKRKSLIANISKVEGELRAAEGRAARAAAEEAPAAPTEAETEAAEEAAEEAIRNKAEAEIDEGPIGQAIAKIENGDIETKAQIRTFIKKLERDGTLDDVEDVREGLSDREQDASEVLDTLSGLLDDARDNAIDERVDELLEERAQEPAAEEPAEEPSFEVETPEGNTLSYPAAYGLVNTGYTVLALNDPRTYTDKGGTQHRTFEKDGARIAVSPNQVLFEWKGRVQYGMGNPNELTLEMLAVDPKDRGKGKGTQVLKDLTKVADQYGITLYGEPVPIVNLKQKDVGLDFDQLVNLYKKFDFKFQETDGGVSERVIFRQPEAEVLPAAEPQIAGQVGFEPYTIEGDFTEVAEEQQRLMLEDQTENLSDDQVSTLEKHYGAKVDSDEFFTKLREDVSNFIVKGATAVNGKIRAIIRQLANGVLAVGIAFNPQYMSQPLNVMMPTDNVRTEEVLAKVPDAATAKMSEPAKRAFAVIYPAIQEQMVAKDKLFIMADKPSGRVFVFNPDGSLLLEKKSLFGLAKGDLYVGDNDKPQNRITPAGLFDLKLVDAQKGESEKRTAGDYDTGTVLAINDPDGTITIMHSVWLKEKDAAQRAAALRNESPADSRYSFGCINVDAPTYKYMVDNHAKQMDGAALFIVPEAGVDVMSFITGKGAMSEDLARIKIKPVTKEVRTPQRQATQAEAKTKTPGREQQFFSLEKQTGTPAFKKFFGDSKVVDADGNPLVVYHGTIVRPDTEGVKGMGDIMAFDRMFTTQFRKPSIDTVGSFFSTNPGEGGAQMYSGTGEGAAVYPVYLSIKNPYTTTFGTMLRRARMMENGVDDGRKIGAKEVEALRKFLKEAGKDGIHIIADPKSAEFKDQDVWIALEPEQIKSATGNIGTFDESGNINKSLGDDLVKLTDQMAGDMAEDEKKRSPSLIRKLKTYNRQRKAGKMSDEMYVLMTDAAIREDYENDLLNPAKPRQRGYLHIQEKLSAAVRRGELTREAYDLANWFMQQNEALVDDLGISIKANKREGAGGFYNNLSRIITLFKNGGSDLTTVHEILHHLERMMPLKIQQAIRKAWLTQLTKAAKATKDPVQKLYFEAVLDANFGDNKHAMVNVPEGAGVAYSNARMALEDMARGNTSVKLAEMLLLQGAVPLDMYQFFNPSEFWAVNGSRIVEGRFEAVKGGTLSKLKNWLRELGQTIKSLFGLKSDVSIIRALDSLAKSDGNFVTDEMLGVGDYQSIERRNYQGGEAPQPDMEIPEMSFMDDVIYKYGDKLIDTKRLIQSINSTGKKLNEQFDAYMKEENYHGRLAKRTGDFLNDEMRPVLEEMQEKNVTLDELETFLLNRHAKEANAYIAKINPTGFPEAGSSVSDAAADKYMAELTPEKRKDLAALAAKVDKIVKETQRVLVANGLETQDTIDEWNATYKNYVPLQRDNLDFVHTGRGVMGGFATRGSASKRRVGSDKPVIDIFANIAMQRERALRRSEQARVGRALYGMAIKHPNPGFWLAINPDAIKDKDKLEAELISLGLKPEDAQNIIQEPRQPMFDKKTGQVKYQVNPLLRNSPNVFPVRINGEDRFIFFNPNDPRALRMVESIKNLDTERLGDVIGTVGMVTRWFASVNTQYNIVFGGVNFLRDLGAASLNLSTTEIAGKEKQVRANVLPALRAIYRDLRGKGATTEAMAEMQDWFERFQLAGGQTGYQNQFAETARKGNVVEQELKRLNRGNVKKSVDAVFDWLSDYNDAIENAVRLSAFKVAVESGLSEDKAASIAKNLTVNFNRKGARTGLISSLYAFFNAAIQGSARMVETLRGPMGKKIIFGGMFLGSMQAIVLAMAGFDDDEPPEFVKDKNFIIPIPFSDKKYLSIPMPLGFNMFPGIGRLAMEALLIETGTIRSRKGPGDKVMSAVSLVFDAFNPLGGAGNPLLMAMPTILDPFAAIYSNRDAFGRPIYREDKGNAPTPGYERSRENSSLFSKKLAEAINWATSPAGTQHTKGFFSPTADQIDYFIGQVTGGVGREIMKVGEFAKSKAVTQEEVPAYKLPIVGRFYGEAESPAATRSRFYENVKEMAKHEHEIKGLRKDKVSPAEYVKANPEARLWQRANNVENQIVKLNKEKRALIEKDAPREAIKRKEDEILKKMTDFNNQVRRGQ